MEGSDSDEERNVLVEHEDIEDERSDGDGEGAALSTDEDVEQFDISLAATHSYMGGGMVCVGGRSVLEPGWTGRVPVMAHHGSVFPGETVPMLLTHPQDIDHIQRAVKKDKLFGLLCPNETGSLASGWGVVCEVFEAGACAGAGGGAVGAGVSFKARATQRFRLVRYTQRPPPLVLYSHLKMMEIRVLPELKSSGPLTAARLHSLDPLRRGDTTLDRRLRRMEAALTPWPLYLYDLFDYSRIRKQIKEYFKEIMLESVPEEPVSLSFWVASNLALSARDRLALFTADHALLRLHMELHFINRKSVLCCISCMNEIGRRDHVFAMSSEGVHSNYTNLGGYMHDLVTVRRARRVVLSGEPSAQYSWFPGYTWTVALCQRCTKHVGWRFDAMKRNLRPQQFFGLCRNYVQPRSEDSDMPHPTPHEVQPDSDDMSDTYSMNSNEQ